MVEYHKRKKSQRKKKKKKSRKNIFLFLYGLRIAYILLTYTPYTRFRFAENHAHLAKAYCRLLNLVSKELNLPVLECKICKIKFLPDHRGKHHQQCCPYGCIELNKKKNKQKAKNKYRKCYRAKMAASACNTRYRERKRNGQVSGIAEVNLNLKETERKLRNEIKFLYRKFNPDVSDKKLKQLDRILRKLSKRIKT